VEANPGESVTYTFTASEPGTYHYHSGTRPDLQVEMGLVGALIVYPMMGGMGGMPMGGHAYDHMDSEYDVEYLFLLTEMDPVIHRQVEAGLIDQVDTTKYWPVYWFINGRAAPDTMADNNAVWLPTQPYNCMPMMEPGQRLLMRVIGGGRDLHPFHFHGNHATIIAKDGRLLQSAPGAGADLSHALFTIQSTPGQTVDAIFEWTGEKLGWDIYGHSVGDALEPNEYAPDHGKLFPVTLPNPLDLTFGGMWSGSPFLGAMGSLPPGEGGMNPNAGFTYMWHSHTEKEMVNNDVFPGGLMTMLVINPPGTMMMMADTGGM
jgi:FtsP/CotA-like multicopper oxidase with cupredoxin domain